MRTQVTYRHHHDTTRGKEGEVAFESTSPFVPPIGGIITWPGCEIGMMVDFVQCDYETGVLGHLVLAKITVWLRK